MSAALGALGDAAQIRLRISLLFAAFEAGMPLIGLGLGAPVGHAIGKTADYVAIGVLLAFGLYTLLGAEEDEKRLRRLGRPTGAAALLLGLSISLDELAIGFTLGLLRLPVGLVIGLIAAQAFIVSQLGLRLGHQLSGTPPRGRRTRSWNSTYGARVGPACTERDQVDDAPRTRSLALTSSPKIRR